MTLHCFAAGQDSEKQLFRGDVASFCPLGLLASTSVRVKQSYNGSVCVCVREAGKKPQREFERRRYRRRRTSAGALILNRLSEVVCGAAVFAKRTVAGQPRSQNSVRGSERQNLLEKTGVSPS